MRSGDFVYIDYIGRVKDTGEVFDTTNEEIAKKEGVYNPQIKYKPVPVVVDGGYVIKGLNDVLKDMNVGEKRKVEIDPENAFGERSIELIKSFPLSLFKENRIDPTPGSYVTINNIRGRIISNDGGRVKVDFNHPLAGKKLEYEIEIKGLIEDTDEKIKSIVHFFTGIELEKIYAELKEKNVEIKILDRVDLNLEIKKKIAAEIKKWIKDIEKVKFIDEY